MDENIEDFSVDGYFSNLNKNTKIFGTTEKIPFLLEELYEPKISPDWTYFVKFNPNVKMHSAAKDGGIIVIKEENDYSNNPRLFLFNSDLTSIAKDHPITIQLPYPSQLFDFYVTAEEIIICVDTKGKVYFYNQRGQIIDETCISEGEINVKNIYTVSNVFFWETGLIIKCSNNNLHILKNFSESTTFEYFNLCPESFRSVCISPPRINSPKPYILGAYEDNFASTNYVVWIPPVPDEYMKEETLGYRYDQMRFTEDYEFLAVLASTPFSPSNFSNTILIFNNDDFINPTYELTFPFKAINFNWIGLQIALTIQNKLENDANGTGEINNSICIIGDDDTTIKFNFDSPILTVQETDSLRIFTKTNVYLIRQLNENIYSFINNSKNKSETHPGSHLFTKMLDQKGLAQCDPFSDEKDLKTALDECLEAAEFFLDSRIKEKLLNTYILSKSQYHVEKYQEILQNTALCKWLSETENLHMVLTTPQLVDLKDSNKLILRLCNRFQHQIATKIASYLREKQDIIQQHFVHSVVRSNANPEQIMDILKKNGSNFDNIELAQLCASIQSRNRSSDKGQLKQLLLDQNQIKSKCVPMNIQDGKWDEAISNAVKSNDEGLLIYVLSICNDKKIKITDTLLKNPIALKAWMLIQKNVDVNVLQKSGHTKEAFIYNFDQKRQNKAPMTSLIREAKEKKEDFNATILSNFETLSKANEDLGINGTAIDVIDKYLQLGKESDALSFAKKMKMDKKDVTWRKAHLYMRHPTKELAASIFKEFSSDDLALFMEMLHDSGKTELFKALYPSISDKSVIERLSEYGIKPDK